MSAAAETGPAQAIDWPHIAKDALAAAFIAFALAMPIIGLRTVATPQGLSIEPRYGAVAIAVALVFVGRIVFDLWWHRRRTHPATGSGLAERLGATRAARQVVGVGVIAGLGFAVLLPVMPFADRDVLDAAILVVMYVMLGWGLNIVVGLADLLDLGYVAFYAIGAYAYALIAQHFGWSFWICLPLAGLFAAMFAMLLGLPVLRLRGDYLAIVTLGFGETVRVVLLNWHDLTNGPEGISGIPRPSFFGLDHSSLHRIVFLYYLILILALITNAFTLRIRRLPIGRAWAALREDEIACRALGINPTNTRLAAYAIGAMFAGVAGAFFATRQGFVSPENFTFAETAVILAIVVLGGMGRSQLGVAIAAVVLVGGTELFRGLQDYRMLAFGLAMVAIMVWRPNGLLAPREPTMRLHPRGGP